jgi:hypothetical protein
MAHKSALDKSKAADSSLAASSISGTSLGAASEFFLAEHAAPIDTSHLALTRRYVSSASTTSFAASAASSSGLNLKAVTSNPHLLAD